MGLFKWLFGKRDIPKTATSSAGAGPAPHRGRGGTRPTEPEVADAFARGVRARLAGNYQEALREFEGLIATAPAHLLIYKAFFEHARCLQFLKRYDEALAEYEHVIRDLQARVPSLPAHAHLDPGSPFVYLDDAIYHRAYVLYEMGRASEAETIFRELTRMPSPGAALDLGTPTTSHRDDAAAMLQIIAEERQRKAHAKRGRESLF